MMRLKNLPTLHIDAERVLSFTYRGNTYHGLAGETVATALYAGSIRVFGRSLKYHRPRGLYSLDAECANTLMEVDGIPNVPAETTFLAAGMAVKPQNIKGSPEFDLMGFMDALSWAMPAGFYYRVFHKPARIWPTAIKQIRQAAGLGVLSPDFCMKGRFDEIYPGAEVCVIGGGPAGMAAALAADDSYFAALRRDYRARRDRLCAGLRAIGFGVIEPQGTYFAQADIRPLGFEDDLGFCRMLPERVGVAAIPTTAFYANRELARHLVRFAFCKTEATLDEALVRLRRLRG